MREELVSYVISYFVENGDSEIDYDDLEHCIEGATDAMIDYYNQLSESELIDIVKLVNEAIYC